MGLTLCLESESFVQGSQLHDLYDRLINLSEVADQARELGDNLYKSDDIYTTLFHHDQELVSWMYDAPKSAFRDERKFLMQLTERARSITTNDYNGILSDVKTGSLTREVALVCLSCESPTPRHILSTDELLLTHRLYLPRCHQSEVFLERAVHCFPNLFFHERVLQSLNTLSAPFSEYVGEIVRHLEQLNDLFPTLFAEQRNNLPEVLRRFEIESSVSCTLEGNKQSARDRFTFEFMDRQGNPVRIVCEPHTKLESTGTSGDTKYRFDRIYFNQGQNDVENGRILIGHIGEHL